MVNDMKSSSSHDDFAGEYDSLVKEYEAYASEVLFGLVFEFVKENDKLLDLGIGTGLSSKPFKRMGLEIYGIDNSEKMLKVCREKGIAKDLKVFDLSNDELPYDDDEFDHIIANGVFHFFEDLEHFFKQSRRILKKSGTFSFTVEDLKNSNEKISERIDEKSGIKVYRHRQDYIEELIEKYDFKLLKRLRFLAFNDPSKKEKYPKRVVNTYICKHL